MTLIGFFHGIADAKLESLRKPIERQINDRRGVQRQQLTQNQATDNGDSQGAAQFSSHARPQSQRQSRQQRRHGGHHDRAKTQQARFVNRVPRRPAFFALGLQSKVNHHDGVFLDDANQQDDSNQRNHAEFRAAQQQRQNRAHSRGWQRG